MSSNTKKRILSSIAIILLFAVLFYLGKKVVLLTIMFVSMGIVDEVFNNFFKMPRNSAEYLFSQISLFAPFIILFFGTNNPLLIDGALMLGVAVNLAMIYFLFKANIKREKFKKLSFLTGIFFLFPLIALGTIFTYDKWITFIVSLFIINFGMDTGAFIFGKWMGKHKLWPKVSPNKTIEGLIGGMFTSATLGSLFWNYFIGDINLGLFFLFALFGLLSQVGDLVQSKFKRTFAIKDSSNLIPGHGGIYDRVDSLIFLAPFFSLALKCLY
ncbi:MAG: hypothetical protein DRQ88_07230 [Epsilonproteobacteria bacterium]|nr:MAG: hypothetical protein DRQ89_03185 [Campylobacterota bacterium]RLA66274.1 MAG: hypothetical protein DRQ88_07230 [Campylobacterota bacterium]